MVADRFVVAGLARARTEWFRSVASWSTSGAVPVEFVGCVSAEELRMHARAGRALSAALLDAGLPSVDRDLVALLRDGSVAPLFVEATGVRRDWRDLGAAAVLPASFTREQLLDALHATAQPISRGEVPGEVEAEGGAEEPAALAPVICVCGPGGTGASTMAIALAQGLAGGALAGGGLAGGALARSGLAGGGRRGRSGRRGRAPAPDGVRDAPVLLADLCLRADQAALHDARDIVPGVQEVVEAYRNHRLDVAELRALTFRVVEHDYHLLLGLRRPLNWTAIRPRAFDAALRGLREAFSYVVADIEPDLESERDSGSIDIEERHVLARAAVASSSVVVVVGRDGLSGLAGLVRTVEELHAHGVDLTRVLPVCSPASRSPARRAEFNRAFAGLLDVGRDRLPGIVFLPRRRVDDALRDGSALPAPLPRMLTQAVLGLLDRLEAPEPLHARPAPVRPGSLGLSGH